MFYSSAAVENMAAEIAVADTEAGFAADTVAVVGIAADFAVDIADCDSAAAVAAAVARMGSLIHLEHLAVPADSRCLE